MSRRVTLIILALLVNIILAVIMFRIDQGSLSYNVNAATYVIGHALIYWLRPFLFVALVRFFYNLTDRKFSYNTAIGVYSGVWLVLLMGMLYYNI